MIYILEKASEYQNNWDYTFLIVALIAIFIETVLTVSKTFKSKDKIVKEQEKIMHDEKVLDDPSILLKKK